MITVRYCLAILFVVIVIMVAIITKGILILGIIVIYLIALIYSWLKKRPYLRR